MCDTVLRIPCTNLFTIFTIYINSTVKNFYLSWLPRSQIPEPNQKRTKSTIYTWAKILTIYVFSLRTFRQIQTLISEGDVLFLVLISQCWRNGDVNMYTSYCLTDSDNTHYWPWQGRGTVVQEFLWRNFLVKEKTGGNLHDRETHGADIWTTCWQWLASVLH